jgi:hypothetical protein
MLAPSPGVAAPFLCIPFCCDEKNIFLSQHNLCAQKEVQKQQSRPGPQHPGGDLAHDPLTPQPFC